MEENTDRLLVGYLMGELGESDQADFLEWLNADPANKRYYEEVKVTLELLDISRNIQETNVADEWISFRKMITRRHLKIIAGGDSDLQNDRLSVNIQRRTISLRRRIVRLIAAASIFVVSTLLWKYNFRATTSGSFTKKIQMSHEDRVRAYLQYETNSSGRTKLIRLPDGSWLSLMNNSEVSYQVPFHNNKRDIFLKGSAMFNVAKDHTKPFTVFSGNIATTALGTKFLVTAFEKANSSSVKLYEGKVLIKANGINQHQQPNEYILVPGKELLYDKIKFTSTVQSFRSSKSRINKMPGQQKPGGDTLSFSNVNLATTFMFNNQSLDNIFEQLEEMYQVRINYSKPAMRRIYFIGTFSKSESVENILKQIAMLNDLEVIKNDSHFSIISQKIK